MDKQDFFYDALPYLYTIGGVLTLLLTGEMIGRVSGLLLVSAAMMVFHLRLQHRTARAAKAEMRLDATKKVLAKTKREMLQGA
jgi:uncharacterized phosphosugar-binding protein